MPLANAYATLRSENSREGGEGIPDELSWSRMKVGAQMFSRCFERQNQNTKIKRKVNTMLNVIRQLVKEEDGASAAEYALLLVVITLGILGAVQLLGGNITTAINTAAGTLTPS